MPHALYPYHSCNNSFCSVIAVLDVTGEGGKRMDITFLFSPLNVDKHPCLVLMAWGLV